MGSSRTLLAMPETVEPATHLRSTVIVNSLMELRVRGLEDRYWELVPEDRHQELREIVPASWAPMDLAIAHYTAMQALGLPRAEVVEIGGAAGDRLHKSFIGTIVRSLRAAGTVTPATLLTRLDRVFKRAVRGGGIGAWQTGPKDARVHHKGFAMVKIPYVRAGWEGMYLAGLRLVAKTVYVREAEHPTPDSVVYVISWV